jgi:hypothetical protein
VLVSFFFGPLQPKVESPVLTLRVARFRSLYLLAYATPWENLPSHSTGSPAHDFALYIAAMAEAVGDKALSGEWERISNKRLEIKENMVMMFEGQSCNITNEEGNLVESLGLKDGVVTRNLSAGDVCYILLARVKFEKRQD